jgi:uncharacterized surface protein with fasciclin (FAS1) repeats
MNLLVELRLIFTAALFAALAQLAISGPAKTQDASPNDAGPKNAAPASSVPPDSTAPFELSVEVGGAAMYPSRTIIENAAASKDHTNFVAALKAAGLSETLEGAGPFTVLAPVNRAFERLPDGMAELLLDPQNVAALKPVLAYHVLAGRYSAADFIASISKAGGRAAFPTLDGEDLTVRQDGRRLEIIDARGRKATITISDVPQKNGVVHVIDAILLPKS